MKKNTKLKRAKIICSAIILTTACIASSSQAAKAAGIGSRVRNAGTSVTSGLSSMGNSISNFFSNARSTLSRFAGNLTSCFRTSNTSGGYTVEGTVSPDGTVYSTVRIKNSGGGPTSVLPEGVTVPNETIYTTVKVTNAGGNNGGSGRSSRLSTFSNDSSGSTSPYAVIGTGGTITNPKKSTNNSTSNNSGATYENLGYSGHNSAMDPLYASIQKSPKNVTVTSTGTSNNTSQSPTKTPPPVAPKPKTPTPPPRTVSLGPNSTPINNGSGNTNDTKLSTCLLYTSPSPRDS